MNMTARTLAILAIGSLLSAPSRAASPATETADQTAGGGMVVNMDATAPEIATDPALQAWREVVLPGIRAFMESEREAIAALGAECLLQNDPSAQRDLERRIEQRKLAAERQLLVRQLEWAQAWQRGALRERLGESLHNLDTAHPELAAAGVPTTAAGPQR